MPRNTHKTKPRRLKVTSPATAAAAAAMRGTMFTDLFDSPPIWVGWAEWVLPVITHKVNHAIHRVQANATAQNVHHAKDGQQRGAGAPKTQKKNTNPK